jgi:hypothetical protein
MNLRTKLESKEGQWIRIHFADGTQMTGRLQVVGNDFIQVECFSKDEKFQIDTTFYAQHLVPLHLVKFLTIESSQFIEAERMRLEFIAKNTRVIEEDWRNNLPKFQD